VFVPGKPSSFVLTVNKRRMLNAQVYFASWPSILHLQTRSSGDVRCIKWDTDILTYISSHKVATIIIIIIILIRLNIEIKITKIGSDDGLVE
jgi:hypothetical protein